MVERKIQIKFKEIKHEELESSDKNLVELAIDSAKTAYAPYSHFRVGAAVLLENGEIVKGSNQENAAYPSGLCAERVALFYANSVFPDTKVNTIVVVVIDSENQIIKQTASPCGSCRQVIAEAEMRFEKPIRMVLVSKESILIFDSIEDLLPLSFKQKDLLL